MREITMLVDWLEWLQSHKLVNYFLFNRLQIHHEGTRQTTALRVLCKVIRTWFETNK